MFSPQSSSLHGHLELPQKNPSALRLTRIAEWYQNSDNGDTSFCRFPSLSPCRRVAQGHGLHSPRVWCSRWRRCSCAGGSRSPSVPGRRIFHETYLHSFIAAKPCEFGPLVITPTPVRAHAPVSFSNLNVQIWPWPGGKGFAHFWRGPIYITIGGIRFDAEMYMCMSGLPLFNM